MKKLIAGLTAGLLLLSGSAVFADEEVQVSEVQAVTDVSEISTERANVVLNGQALEFDVQPIIIDGRTMVPLRSIFEALGAQVEWIDADQLILATKSYKMISLKIDSNMMYIADISQNLNSSIELDVAPMLISDRTLVPLRAVSEAFGATVEWDEATSTVTITA